MIGSAVSLGDLRYSTRYGKAFLYDIPHVSRLCVVVFLRLSDAEILPLIRSLVIWGFKRKPGLPYFSILFCSASQRPLGIRVWAAAITP